MQRGVVYLISVKIVVSQYQNFNFDTNTMYHITIFDTKMIIALGFGQCYIVILHKHCPFLVLKTKREK